MGIRVVMQLVGVLLAMFSHQRCAISSMKLEMEVTEDIELIVRSAVATVTESDCQNWIKDSGIYNMN